MHRDTRLESARSWLARANGDLALSRVPLPEGGFLEDLCLHAQQAAERAIKSVYLLHEWNFRYVHNIGIFLGDLRRNGIAIPPEIESAAVLTPYAAEMRYPDDSIEPVDEESYRVAIALAEAVVRWADAQFGAISLSETE